VKLWHSRGGTGIVPAVVSDCLRNGDYENIIKCRPVVPSLCVHIYRSQKISYEETAVELCKKNEFLSALRCERAVLGFTQPPVLWILGNLFVG